MIVEIATPDIPERLAGNMETLVSVYRDGSLVWFDLFESEAEAVRVAERWFPAIRWVSGLSMKGEDGTAVQFEGRYHDDPEVVKVGVVDVGVSVGLL